MPSAIAIDFGTSRTKLAYLDTTTGRPELMRLGQRDDPFIPSLFYLPRDSEDVLIGDDAEAMLAQDAAGIIDVLKRKLDEAHVRANRRRETPQALLARLFAQLRDRVSREIPLFNGQSADKLNLTVPAIYGPAQERVLREAADQAGFAEVRLIPEPIAAAQAWLAHASPDVPGIVVCDCGGGTIDWAYLRRAGDDFHLVPECPPGGDRVGGHDIDRELLAHIEDRLDDDQLAALHGHEVEYLQLIRIIKERYCRGLPLLPLCLGPSQITLSTADIEDAFEARFIRHASEGLKGYLTQVRAVAGADQPPVLLVGGSARVKGLREALEQACDCETLSWERADYATVLGAVAGVVAESVPVVSSTAGLPSESKPEPEPEVNQQPVAADALISGRYRDHGDGTVTDVKTGLQWMRCALGQTWKDETCTGEGVEYAWKDALQAAEAFNEQGGYAGYDDWVVPTLDELKTLIFCSSGDPKTWNDTGRPCAGAYSKPVIDTLAFPNANLPFWSHQRWAPPNLFWSSSPYAGRSDNAWGVFFGTGYVSGFHKNLQTYVRLVRVLGAVPGIVAASVPVVSSTSGLPSEPKPEPEVKQQPAAADVLISGRYRDHGDGTVTDVKTGLQWMRCALGQTWRDGACIGEEDFFAWKNALQAAETVNKQGGYASHRDWRVPTIDELKTLVFCSSGKPKTWNDTNRPCEGAYSSPAIDQTAFPNTANSMFWSSSPGRRISLSAWCVSFDYGYVSGDSKSSQLYVRLVRGGQ